LYWSQTRISPPSPEQTPPPTPHGSGKTEGGDVPVAILCAKRVSSIKLKQKWMKQAIELAVQNVKTANGGPFGALVVQDGTPIASGTNLVTVTNDPTAHAEIVAIRSACQRLETFQLAGCELYTSCEPCPMCLSAIYWARPDRFYYAASRADAAAAGFDDAFIYDQVALHPERRAIDSHRVSLERDDLRPFEEWISSLRKIPY
jgi:guanine deaminase